MLVAELTLIFCLEIAGTDPNVLGESANAITTYGYDPATGMQEAKVTLCQIMAA
jgi:formate dehydrogenase major subunit